MIRVKKEFVTPEIAARWLELNEKNRSPRDWKAEEYARDMTEGRWLTTGETIQFGESGRLLNGQHRLWAVLMSGATIEMIVIRGIENEEAVMDVLDTGTKRTLGDALGIHGETDANVLASIVNGCIRFERATDPSKNYNPSHSQAMEWLKENPGAREAVLIAREVNKAIKAPPGGVGVAYYENARVDAEAAERFWHLAATGEGLGPGDAVLAYRRWVIGTLARRDKPRSSVWLAVHLKAMKLWREGRSVRLISYKDGEEAPGVWT
jgi:hypothetical protein